MPKDPSLSKAAGILGRIKTPKKAASSAENGRKNLGKRAAKKNAAQKVSAAEQEALEAKAHNGDQEDTPPTGQ